MIVGGGGVRFMLVLFSKEKNQINIFIKIYEVVKKDEWVYFGIFF